LHSVLGRRGQCQILSARWNWQARGYDQESDHAEQFDRPRIFKVISIHLPLPFSAWLGWPLACAGKLPGVVEKVPETIRKRGQPLIDQLPTEQNASWFSGTSASESVFVHVHSWDALFDLIIIY
jgi:hypothetical protein